MNTHTQGRRFVTLVVRVRHREIRDCLTPSLSTTESLPGESTSVPGSVRRHYGATLAWDATGTLVARQDPLLLWWVVAKKHVYDGRTCELGVVGATADATGTGNPRDDFTTRRQSRSSRPKGSLVVKSARRAGRQIRPKVANVWNA